MEILLFDVPSFRTKHNKMKIIFSAILIAAFSIGAKAQDTKEPFRFSHWVIESNVKTPRISTVKFYNDKLDLIYEESISGKKIKIAKRKVRDSLDQALAQVLARPADSNRRTFLSAMAKNW